MDHNEWLANEQHMIEKDIQLKKYSDSYVSRKMFMFLSLLFFFMPSQSITLESRGQEREFAWFCDWCHNKNKPNDQWCTYCQRRRCVIDMIPPQMQLDYMKFSKEEHKIVNDFVHTFLEMSEEDMESTYEICGSEIFGLEIAYHIAKDTITLQSKCKSRAFFEVLEDEEEEEIQIRK